MILRSGNSIDNIMPDEMANSNNIQHTITQRTPQILKFCGRIEGSQSADVETFIESLENHLSASHITKEEDRLREAKSFLDLSKGDVHLFTNSWKFKQICTFSQFKDYLRHSFGINQSTDVVKTLSKIFRIPMTSEGTYLELSSELYKQLNAWKAQCQNSDWTEGGKISIENMLNLLHIAMTLSYLPNQLVEAIKEPWKKENDIADLQERVMNNKEKCKDIDLSRVIAKKQVASITIANVDSRNSHPKKKHFQTLYCNICRKDNHHTRDCFYNYCTFHKRKGHTTENCYQFDQSRNKRSNSRNRNNDREKSKHQYQRDYNDQQHIRSELQNQSNFQSGQRPRQNQR